MKAFKIVLLAICLTLIVGSTLVAKDKGKKGESAVAFTLDDSRLVPGKEADYAKELQVKALESLTNLDLYLGQNDFASISAAYQASTDCIALSEQCALQALDLRKNVVAAQAEINATGAGNAGGDAANLSMQTQEKLADLKSGKSKLSAEQRGFFLVSLTSLAAAIALETKLVSSAKNYPDYVKGLGKLAQVKEAKNLPEAAKMVSTLPGTITSQLGTLATYITIATTNGIEIPKEVKLP